MIYSINGVRPQRMWENGVPIHFTVRQHTKGVTIGGRSLGPDLELGSQLDILRLSLAPTISTHIVIHFLGC